jgi:hypothetical protein
MSFGVKYQMSVVSNDHVFLGLSDLNNLDQVERDKTVEQGYS